MCVIRVQTSICIGDAFHYLKTTTKFLMTQFECVECGPALSFVNLGPP